MAESKQHQKNSTEKQIMVLKKLGFSDDEARIYHVLLVSKESTVGETVSYTHLTLPTSDLV